MKKPIIIGCVILVVLLLAIDAFRAAENDSRRIQKNYMFRSLSIRIEMWREDKGYYPQTLSQLVANYVGDEQSKKGVQDLVGLASSNVWHYRYDYKPSTNGFTITVTGPDEAPTGWFGKTRSMTKHYVIGEAWKEFNSPQP
jgi:hypothetical protein